MSLICAIIEVDMKRFLLSVLLLACAGVRAADDIANQLQERLSFDALSAKFEQRSINSQGEALGNQSGELYLKKPSQILLRTIKPDETVLFTREDGLYFYDLLLNQVNIMPSDVLIRSPFSLLISNDEDLWSRYRLSAQGSSSYVLQAAQQGEVASIKIDFEGSALSALTLTLKDGTISIYTLSQVKNSIDDPSVFEVEIPSDAEVDDGRR